MSAQDRLHWDGVYTERGPAGPDAVGLPPVFAGCESEFPGRGHALELACGRGGAAVWLARRGMEVIGVDVSAAAVSAARDLAVQCDVADRCRFEVADLDGGLPADPPADVIVCHRFWAPELTGAIIGRLAAGGLLAISVLSEVGAAPGRYRAAAGELDAAFDGLDPIAAGEGEGIAWLVARRV